MSRTLTFKEVKALQEVDTLADNELSEDLWKERSRLKEEGMLGVWESTGLYYVTTAGRVAWDLYERGRVGCHEPKPTAPTRFVIRTASGFYLRKDATNPATHPNPWFVKPKVFKTRRAAEKALKQWRTVYPAAGLKIEVREPLAQSGAELDAKLAPVIKAFRACKAEINKLPKGKFRALALIDLESAFSRAIFAASEMKDPIGEVA